MPCKIASRSARWLHTVFHTIRGGEASPCSGAWTPSSPPGTNVWFPSEVAVARTAGCCDSPIPVLLAMQTKFVLQIGHLSSQIETFEYEQVHFQLESWK